MQKERRNSIANALELRLSCTNPLICDISYTATQVCTYDSDEDERHVGEKHQIYDVKNISPKYKKTLIWSGK